jgi:hypothetical protein
MLGRRAHKPIVRPWALAVPILVFVVALPLLRPLRHPGADGVSDDEASRLATIAAVVEHRHLSLEGLDLGPGVPLPDTELVSRNGKIFSSQAPMMAFLLAGPYWALGKFHLTLRSSPVLTAYLLTLIGVTIPIAAAAGAIYKAGRVFDLKRPVRCALAAIVVFGSGLISYAVVLNSHAPAAAFLLASMAAIVHVANSAKPRRNIWWLLAAGFCASLAAAVDPPAAVFPIPFFLAIFAMRWPIVRRSAGAALFACGMLPPMFLHLALNYPITGDWKPAVLHRELLLTRTGTNAALASWGTVGAALAPASQPSAQADEDQPAPVGLAVLNRPGLRLIGATLGQHGLLSHFPLLILGMIGMYGVLRQNWPGVVKLLALACATGALVVVVGYCWTWADVRGGMFANRWFVVVVPLVLIWSGAWLRWKHRAMTWIAAGLLLVFSTAVSLLGATDPLPRGGYDSYTARAALDHWLEPVKGPRATPFVAGTDRN